MSDTGVPAYTHCVEQLRGRKLAKGWQKTVRILQEQALKGYNVAAGRPPSSFPQDGLQIDFRDTLHVSAQLGDMIEGLLVRLPAS